MNQKKKQKTKAFKIQANYVQVESSPVRILGVFILRVPAARNGGNRSGSSCPGFVVG
uniref:Uncharacterized protein n=1 Tax=Rhizophora mucronata TaxID=61149 RepID=A0A2P2KRY0_RHIMU